MLYFKRDIKFTNLSFTYQSFEVCSKGVDRGGILAS